MSFYKNQGGNPPPSELITAKKTWKNLNATAVVNKWFNDFTVTNHIDKTVRRKLNVVIDDLLTNIICYAFDGISEPEIEIKLELSASMFVITFVDNGRSFNPFEESRPVTSLSITEREIGGLGIHLSRELTDDISYQRADGKNIIKVTLNLPDEMSGEKKN